MDCEHEWYASRVCKKCLLRDDYSLIEQESPDEEPE
jgi:hypothetical protein